MVVKSSFLIKNKDENLKNTVETPRQQDDWWKKKRSEEQTEVRCGYGSQPNNRTKFIFI